MSMIEGVLAGMAARTKQQTDAEDRAYLKKKREQEEEDRAFAMSERQRAVQLRTDMGRAAATVEPVEVKETRPDTMDNRDVGQAGEAPLPTAGYDVAGKRFTTKEDAATAATAANTPQAVTTRMSDVLMRNGDPVQAQKLRVGAMEEQTAQFKLNDAQRADIDARFNADLQANVKDFGSLADFISNSAGDGLNGKLKVKFVPSADGKTQVLNVVGPDGTLTPTERVVPNTADGLATAIAETARMPVDKKLAHLHNKAMLAQQAERDAATAKYHEGMLKISQQNANTYEQYRRDQAAALKAKADAAGGPGGMTMADLKDGHKSIATTLNADWKTQIESETDPAKLKAIKSARENEIATVQRLYTGAMQAGFAMTPEQAIVAFRNGDTAQQKFKARDGSGTVTVDGILYGGRFIPLAANPGAAPGAAEPPSTVAEAIRRDAEKTGVKDFVVDINGRKQAYGNAKLDGDPASKPSPGPSMAARAGTAEPRIPDPPPARVQQGVRMVENPAYAAWLKKYGDDAPERLAAQKAAEKAAKDKESARASAAARQAFNPYAQPRVN